ncbi:hypothetical protein KKG41_02825 [Patescibacteria group bacterium]|nr:hypothetical protein [Patescibacteria group bacterium]MBU1890070.1 hypothetical protein [Patescibacteria group bacterium]
MNFLDIEKKDTKTRTRAVFVLLLMFSLVLLPLAPGLAQADNELPYPAPTLLTPENGSTTEITKPVITGLSKNDSRVKIFIDDQLNGQFQVTNHSSGTANFVYEPFLDLKPGWHDIYATAVDTVGKTSPQSNVIKVLVEYPMPAPTVYQPVVNKDTTAGRPWFRGLAVNDSLVKVYIDGMLNGQLAIENQASGVADFAYRTYYDITPGKHTMFAVAVDPNGKESKYSEIISFVIPDQVLVDESTAEVLGEETIGDVEEPDEVISEEAETVIEESEDTSEETETTSTETEETMSLADDVDEEEGDEETTDDEESNWPLVIGLMILAIVLIILIDNMVRKSRRDDSGKDSSMKSDNHSSDSGGKPEAKKPTPDELFPPPPPDLK